MDLNAFYGAFMASLVVRAELTRATYHTLIVLKCAAAAEATRFRCIPGAIRPSISSIGTMLAPRAATAAPLTRSITVWFPVPSAAAAAA